MKEKNNNRILELDLLRGIAVFLMIFDHFMYDLWGLLPSLFVDYPFGNPIATNMYRFSIAYWNSTARIVIRYIVIFVFLALTGICCHFSKSNLKRGFRLLIASLLLSLVTFFVGWIMNDIDIMVSFGILHAISLSLLMVGLLEKFCKNKWVYLVLGVLMLGVGGYFEANATIDSFKGNNFFLIVLKQMVGMSFAGSDSFGLLSTAGQIFIGVFLGKLLYNERKSVFNFKYSNNVVTFFGRNSLVVYLLHQILIPVILVIALLCFGFTLYS